MASPTLQFKRGLFVNLPALRAGEPGFTTDKNDLYIGIGGTTPGDNKFFGSHRYWVREDGTNAAEFKFVDKDGDNGVSLRAPAQVSTPVTYTLPEGGATTGHFLKLGQNGVLEWASVTSGASFGDVSISNATFSGISTFSGAIDADAGLDVTGHTVLNNTLAVTGVSTFTGAINANGGVLGNVTGNLTGNAGTATSLATARNFEITGAFVTAAAVSFDGTGNVALAATVAPNSIQLGTYTSGNYVATVAGTANQISVSGSGSETAAVTLSLPNDVVVGTSLSTPTVKTATIQHSNGTEAITISSGGNVGVSTNLTVSGNLIVNGTTTQVNTTSLTVEDTLVELGLVDGAAPGSDVNKDLGIVFNYYTDAAKKAAVYWDDSTGRIKVASDVTEENSTLTAVANGALEIGGLYVAGCGQNTVEVIGCVDGEVTITNAVIDGGVWT